MPAKSYIVSSVAMTIDEIIDIPPFSITSIFGYISAENQLDADYDVKIRAAADIFVYIFKINFRFRNLTGYIFLRPVVPPCVKHYFL